ncbi:MAG: Asp-tRNA(Asn)/Glu-tRNA(Gln) amidotransferase subunit GatB [Flavobacteriales bacterium]|nr:Asp-tRNA(Asn)/Glu-tRNA(Gln) amidotransferase subunit GatB [Flavobacteriales bacterium]
MSTASNIVVGSSESEWELVVGLEVHAQLITASKAYSSDPNMYGDHPNTNISPITLGHPGTLPVLNKKVVEHAVRLGTAMHCTIAGPMHFARKNYFYPDLPKGYQITQDKTPICTNGCILIPNGDGDKRVGITRIHMEEDAGKSIHDVDPFNTLIDLNRAGVPLLEIVSEPDIRSGEEAYNYLVEIRRLVRYLDICDGNMEEGSLRCDANISVRRKGDERFGTRTEVKNMNSFRNVQRAIAFEAQRQVRILENGGTIHMETRTFDAAKGITIGMRSKELAHDYRYFPEPDLAPLVLTEKDVERLTKDMPPLPRELRSKYTQVLNLSAYDAEVLTDDRDTALYFEAVIGLTKNHKAAANWVMGEVRAWVNQHGSPISEIPIGPERIAQLIDLIDSGKVSHSIASQRLFPAMLAEPGTSPEMLAQRMDLIQERNEAPVQEAMRAAMERYPDKVKAYREGNKGLLGLFMGEVMKATKGKADPKHANMLVKRLLEETPEI